MPLRSGFGSKLEYKPGRGPQFNRGLVSYFPENLFPPPPLYYLLARSHIKRLICCLGEEWKCGGWEYPREQHQGGGDPTLPSSNPGDVEENSTDDRGKEKVRNLKGFRVCRRLSSFGILSINGWTYIVFFLPKKFFFSIVLLLVGVLII